MRFGGEFFGVDVVEPVMRAMRRPFEHCQVSSIPVDPVKRPRRLQGVTDFPQVMTLRGVLQGIAAQQLDALAVDLLPIPGAVINPWFFGVAALNV